MSVYDNIAYGPRTFGIKARSVLDGINRDGAPNQDNATLICAEIARA